MGKDEGSPGGSHVTPVSRRRAADEVFDQIARTILSGELKEGDALPPERVLAERFAVSRTIVRQAVHKLADAGLVRVRQGGTTTALSADKCTDTRILELHYRTTPRTDRERREMTERRLLQGLAIVLLSSLRAPKSAFAPLIARSEALGMLPTNEVEFADFERDMWLVLASHGDNRLVEREVRWWFDNHRDNHVEAFSTHMPTPMRAPFYRELLRRLAEDDEPTPFYLRTVFLVFKFVAMQPTT
ncbi:MAG: GntR family transcriptional regulator [Polyangiaceae bacterium]